MHTFTLGAEGQGVTNGLAQLGNEQVRIVFPAEVPLNSERVELLIDIVQSQAPFPGLPVDVLDGERITISLAKQPVQGIDARVSTVQRLIVLPLVDAFEWDHPKLRRVIRHELAHIALDLFMGFHQLPGWFEEGFAEWAAGGLSCEGKLRVGLEISLRRRDPALSDLRLTDLGRSRLSYDLFATFFEYLEARKNSAVSHGTVLSSIKKYGLDEGLIQVFGLGFPRLEEGWRTYLTQRYDDVNEISGCEELRQLT